MGLGWIPTLELLRVRGNQKWSELDADTRWVRSELRGRWCGSVKRTSYVLVRGGAMAHRSQAILQRVTRVNALSMLCCVIRRCCLVDSTSLNPINAYAFAAAPCRPQGDAGLRSERTSVYVCARVLAEQRVYHTILSVLNISMLAVVSNRLPSLLSLTWSFLLCLAILRLNDGLVELLELHALQGYTKFWLSVQPGC